MPTQLSGRAAVLQIGGPGFNPQWRLGRRKAPPRPTLRAHPDLSQGPADLQSAALTTELCTHARCAGQAVAKGCARRRDGAACGNLRARRCVAPRAPTQASSPLATAPRRNVPTQAAQAWAIRWPFRAPPEKQTSATSEKPCGLMDRPLVFGMFGLFQRVGNSAIS